MQRSRKIPGAWVVATGGYLNAFDTHTPRVMVFQVPGSSFALELLRNPQQYSYESWSYGFAWPVGADGRRLLLRKLRGVYWSDPEKWQRILQENNLYRRDLFTLATVQVSQTPLGVDHPLDYWHPKKQKTIAL